MRTIAYYGVDAEDREATLMADAEEFLKKHPACVQVGDTQAAALNEGGSTGVDGVMGVQDRAFGRGASRSNPPACRWAVCPTQRSGVW